MPSGPHCRRDHRLVFGEPYENPYKRPICPTLEEDEITRCRQPADNNESLRCRVHQLQYRTMYLRYKDASKRAKELKRTGGIPSKNEIDAFNKFGPIVRNLDHVRLYRELVQIEKIGRDIHGRRFFLKRVFIPFSLSLNDWMKPFPVADVPHRNRLKFLNEEIKRASKALLVLKDRAKTLRLAISRRQRDSQPLRLLVVIRTVLAT